MGGNTRSGDAHGPSTRVCGSAAAKGLAGSSSQAWLEPALHSTSGWQLTCPRGLTSLETQSLPAWWTPHPPPVQNGLCSFSAEGKRKHVKPAHASQPFRIPAAQAPYWGHRVPPAAPCANSCLEAAGRGNPAPLSGEEPVISAPIYPSQPHSHLFKDDVNVAGNQLGDLLPFRRLHGVVTILVISKILQRHVTG